MLTRSRSVLQLAQLNDEATVNGVGTHETKKRKENPSVSSRRSKRSTAVAKEDDKQTKSKSNANVAVKIPQSVSDNIPSNSRKSPRKLTRTTAAAKSDVRKTKSSASHALGGLQQGTNGLPTTTEEPDEVSNFHNAIKQVLAINYVNVKKRFDLLYPSTCIESLVKCRNEHARNQHIAISDNVITAQTFLKNHQPLMFMHIILMDVLGGKFPGRNLMPLFELIVCINKPSLGEYTETDVIEMASFTITQIMGKFPPCWLAANKEYRTFLTSTTKHLISGSEHFSENRTLFGDLINYIESAIQPSAKRPTTESNSQNSSNNSMLYDSLLNESQDLQSFRKWEKKHTQKFSFDILSRDGKIDRVFTVLSLYVQLFEAYLAMWTLRNIKKPNSRVFDRQKGPLIGSVLWTNGEPNQVNYIIKTILKLFVDYVSIDFPNDELHLLSRLINLIFNIFDLYECGGSPIDEDGSIDYPQPVDKQSYFCDALIKIIFDSNSCSINLWLKIIYNVSHPRLKLRLINALMSKIEHKKIALNPENIYHSMRELERDFDYVFDKTNSRNNNMVQTNDCIANKAGVGGDPRIYPHLQKINKRCASELSYKHQVELHLIALRAYMNIFHIDEVLDYWKNYGQYSDTRKLALKQFRNECTAMKSNTTIEPYDLDEMRKLQTKPLEDRIKEISSRTLIHRLDIIYEEQLNLNLVPKVDIKMYRNDVKFRDLITDDMPKIRSKFDALFPVNRYTK